jgi:hypothetical protein
MKIFNKYIIVSIFSIGFCFLATSTAFANQAPVANAGSDLYLTSGQTAATLVGSGFDADGGNLTYFWSCSGGNLSNYNIAQPIYTAPNITTSNNYDFICTLTVTDNYGLSNSDSAIIYINHNSQFSINVKTEVPTNIYNNQAKLNGSFTSTATNNAQYAWFEYGSNESYGMETSKQIISGVSGTFFQEVSNLFSNGTYHYRAVVQNSIGNKFYGEDVVFTINSNYYNSGSLSVSKKIINITRGNLNWSDSIIACPNDVLSFSITLQATGRDFNNVVIKDTIPINFIYNDNLLINATRDFSSNPINGINLGTIKNGNIVIVSYQVKIGPATSFSFGTTNLTANTVVSSDQMSTQTDTNSIIINNPEVLGATNPTDIATGLTNNLFTESFLLPMLLIIAGSWLYFSGKIYIFADWLESKF